MAGGGRGGRVLGRVLRMALVLWWGALAGGFLWLRSVDPAGVEDQARVEGILSGLGLGTPPDGAAAAVRAGLRDELGKRADTKGREVQLTIDEENAVVQCRAATPVTWPERLYAGLFGVDDPGNREVTAEAYVSTEVAPGVFVAVDVLALSSAVAADQIAGELSSERVGQCLGRALTGGQSGALAALPEMLPRAVAARRFTAAPASAEEPLRSVDLMVIRSGRGVALLATGGGVAIAPDLQELLFGRLESRMGEQLGS